MIEVPSGGQTEVVVAVVVPVVVDAEPAGIEVAEVDTVAVRVDILSAPIHTTES